MRWTRLSATLAALFLAAHVSAQPSFDCARASTATEKAICASPVLSQLDRQLADSYGAARSGVSSAQADAVRRDQIAWIGVRDGCGGDAACLEAQMRNRLLVLQASGAAVAPVATGLSGTYCAGDDTMLVEDHGDVVDFGILSIQGGGHSCGTGKIRAARTGDGYAAISDGCTFRLVQQGGTLVFTAGDEAGCRSFCGMRAMFGTHVFSISDRRPLTPGWTTAAETGGC